ncbi:MAG: DNA polymerase IV [Planctomycetota bacterium]
MSALAPPERGILHVDMDAFFASVEQRDNPELRGKPVLVGGAGRRGVVAAASYEARRFGCRSAMPTAVALRNCPHAVVVRGSYETYKEVSAQVMSILESCTPLVQPVSIDEAFCDVTGSVQLLGEPSAIARRIRSDVRAQTGLTCSVGVAPNKFLAKLASDLDKPDGLTIITRETVRTVLDPLPVSRLWGVGPAAQQRLARLGLRTIGDIAGAEHQTLLQALGDFGAHVHTLALGLDDRPVTPDREAKSISHEQTFGENLADPDAVRAVLLDQAEQVARRLRRHGRLARTVTVKIRFGDFETVTRSRTLDEAGDSTRAIAHAARGLFDQWARQFRSVRLIGVGVSQLGDPAGAAPQLGLFDAETSERSRAVDRATDAIADRFGPRAVQRAGALEARARTRQRGQFGPGSIEIPPDGDPGA